ATMLTTRTPNRRSSSPSGPSPNPSVTTTEGGLSEGACCASRSRKVSPPAMRVLDATTVNTARWAEGSTPNTRGEWPLPRLWAQGPDRKVARGGRYQYCREDE